MGVDYKLKYTGAEIDVKLDLMPSLGITNAEVGQVLKVATVNDNGVPATYSVNEAVSIANGGTGATSITEARANLGLTTEAWTFELEDGTTVTKNLVVIA